MKYIDLIGYPIMLGVVYVIFGLVNWNSNPEVWTSADRCVWLLWSLAWGWGMQCRIARGGQF